jgi:hypothetical protein
MVCTIVAQRVSRAPRDHEAAADPPQNPVIGPSEALSFPIEPIGQGAAIGALVRAFVVAGAMRRLRCRCTDYFVTGSNSTLSDPGEGVALPVADWAAPLPPLPLKGRGGMGGRWGLEHTLPRRPGAHAAHAQGYAMESARWRPAGPDAA